VPVVTNPLPEELSRPVFQAAVVRALRSAYEENQDRHDPEIGHDAITFGSAIWRSGVFFLARELAGVAGVSTEERNLSLSIITGRCRLRVHKLGTSEQDDPLASFPNNVGPASRMGGEDRQLSFDLGEPGVTEYLDWVIGHYGSADDGLRAVRLQAVGSERALDGTISRWEDVETLFDVLHGAAVPVAAVDQSDDVVVAPEPAVALRVVKDTEDSQVNQA
jgi:hypothetical protein